MRLKQLEGMEFLKEKQIMRYPQGLSISGTRACGIGGRSFGMDAEVVSFRLD